MDYRLLIKLLDMPDRLCGLSRLLPAAIVDDVGSTLLAFAGILSVDPSVRPRLS
ncbi:MAG: hypothetical protein ACJ8EW_26540 [Rhizobium sp.]|jgi:hypothetical protein